MKRSLFFAYLRQITNFPPFLVILLLLGALFWAKDQDLFSRIWFTVFADGHTLKCVAVLPKPIRQWPVIIYAHGSGGDLMSDGTDLRQMAELGLVTVSLEYDQSNSVAFDTQFESLLRYLACQEWVNTNKIAWVGFGLGANRMWNFALQHSEQLPQLMVQLSGRGLSENETNILHSITNPQPSTLLIHGDQDEISPLADTERLARILQTNGLSVELKIISNAPHGMGPNCGVIFRAIGEYCLTHLTSKDAQHQFSAWQSYHSITQWQLEALPFWVFCLPAVSWSAGWLIWLYSYRSEPFEKVKLTRSETVLRWLAAIMATWALTETAIHLVTPHFAVSDRTLMLARKFLVQPKERVDFEYLAAQPIWQGQKLKTLLEHVELANYNRQLINWREDDKTYQDYSLSPVITGQVSERLNWRRSLWEEFYPRIRHESSAGDAARVIVRHLRERVTIARLPNSPHDVPTIWSRQITDEAGFEIIYVAALRSTGVAARLSPKGQVELWEGAGWSIAPRPCFLDW